VLQNPWRKPKPEHLRLRETVLTWRAGFERNDPGRDVLAWIIESCGFFKVIETEEQKAAHNWGVYLLENMGMTQGVNYRRLVDAMLNLTIPEEAIDK